MNRELVYEETSVCEVSSRSNGLHFAVAYRRTDSRFGAYLSSTGL
jgi:hypothetical protein